VAVTGDGRRAVTTGGDGTARVWDLDTGAELHTLTGHTYWVTAVAVIGDGRRAVTTGDDGTARVWDLDTGQELVAATLDVQVQGVAISTRTPNQLVIGMTSGAIAGFVLD
jgi:WD40 repeat protein